MRQLQKVTVEAARGFRPIVEEHNPEPDLFRWRLYQRRARESWHDLLCHFHRLSRPTALPFDRDPLQATWRKPYRPALSDHPRSLEPRPRYPASKHTHAITERAAETNPNFGLLMRLERKLGDDSLRNTTLSSAPQH